MNKPRILIVEDDTIVAFDLKRISLGLGYEVIATVALGREAITIAATQAPDAVLMDIALQGSLDGIETARLIKAQLDVPIIYVTAYSDSKTLQRAKQVNPFGYILKPFDDEIIRVTLEMAFYKHKVVRELKFQADLLAQVNDAIVVLDNTRCIAYWNRGAERLYQRTAAEVMRRPLADAYGHRWLDPADEQAANAALHATGVWQGEIVDVRKDGAEIYVETVTSQLINEQGEVIGQVAVNRDITERKRLEAQLLESHKMETIGRLAGGIAHDFNNLLTVMIGYTDLALTTLPADHGVRQDIMQIQKSAVRAAKLTGQLLAFARRQMIEPQVVNLNHLILNLKELLQRLIGEDIELVTTLTDESGLVKIDPYQFEQVLVNLAANARDAMPTGGQFILETAHVILDQREARHFNGLLSGNYVLLTASDTGIGISQDVLPLLFEPFFTTKEVGKGTGLGLAMCHGIIKQIGGDIKAESKLGQGTTFKIYLPKVDVPSLPILQTPELTVRPGSETILLVEDEALVRGIALKALSRFGYTVLSAQTGSEALALVHDRLSEIDLVVTDVVMPQMSGQQLVAKLRALQPDLKVLYMSGYTESAMLNHEISHTGAAFLSKPFTPDLLAYKVREVLDT
ncbi:MAG: response regulator [Chloroflexi bacterium]|nr:response regulator [Chloroflexota bacterium]